MAKKITKIMQCMLALTLSFSAVAFAGCVGGNNPNGGKPQSSVSETPLKMTMSKSELVLIQYEQAYVNVDASRPVSVVWASSNESVATVEDGVITAYGVGEAIITATAEGVTATCVVSVMRSEDYPLLELNQYDAKFRVGTELSVSTMLRFMGDKKTDYTLEVSSSNVAIVEVMVDAENNVTLKGKAVGTATVTVVAEYDGLKVARTISVEIVNA